MELVKQQHWMDESTPRRFEFQKLETSTSIRVLALKPGTDNEPIRGTLEHFDLEELKVVFAHFDALSYVWGAAVYDRTFECQTGIIMITKSLEEALQRLRSTYETLHIWADGICINQEDILERESQVKLMGQVYRQAKQVKIWLGPDPTYAAIEAFRFIKQSTRKLDFKDATMDWSPLTKFSQLEYFLNEFGYETTQHEICYSTKPTDIPRFSHRNAL
jgi:hypothetical protein